MRALIRAFRNRRADRRGLDEADRLIAGGRTGTGLDDLLDAARAPATSGELRGEQAMAAALTAERRRATSAPERPVRVRTRTAVVATAAAAALIAGGTGVAARTGTLPVAAQQQAHRLFEDLGVPAPALPSSTPSAVPSSPVPSSAVPPSSVPSSAAPPPSPTPQSTRTPSPSVTTSPPTGAQAEAQAAWCAAWRTATGGGKPMNGRDRRDLIAAAGGGDAVTEFCASISPPGGSASPSTSPSGSPSVSPSATEGNGKPVKPKKSKEAAGNRTS